MNGLLVGTENGLHSLRAGESVPELGGRSVDALHVDGDVAWAVVDRHALWRRSQSEPWEEVAGSPELRLNCVLAARQGTVVGTAQAHLLTLGPDGLRRDERFERAPGRDTWYTPWGGPPDTRSLSAGRDGTLYANVHVGGILRDGAGSAWTPTIDIDADVHQVLAVPDRGGHVLAATARGMAESSDDGSTWTFHTDGLDHVYSRAVALAGESVLLTTSTGPRGSRAHVFRRRLDASTDEFERCFSGLPEWFDSNIDTGCLVASGERAAFGTAEGTVYVSENAGLTWEAAAEGLPRILCCAFAPWAG